MLVKPPLATNQDIAYSPSSPDFAVAPQRTAYHLLKKKLQLPMQPL